MRIEVYPLYTLISLRDENKVQEALNKFVCKRDEDVCFFLRKLAITSELQHKLRTYVAIDQNSDDLNVVGFFTVGVATVEEQSISEKNNTVPEQIPVFLLSQIARDDRYDHDMLNGAELLANAEDIMQQSSDLTGGSAIFLDCKKELKEYYEDKGYSFISHDNKTNLFRLVKSIYGID